MGAGIHGNESNPPGVAKTGRASSCRDEPVEEIVQRGDPFPFGNSTTFACRRTASKHVALLPTGPGVASRLSARRRRLLPESRVDLPIRPRIRIGLRRSSGWGRPSFEKLRRPGPTNRSARNREFSTGSPPRAATNQLNALALELERKGIAQMQSRGGSIRDDLQRGFPRLPIWMQSIVRPTTLKGDTVNEAYSQCQ